MSQLQQSNEDNHPKAARKHLEDAETLLDGKRADGAAYLSGYVVECTLKSIMLLGKEEATKGRDWGHNLKDLRHTASLVLSHIETDAARYVTDAIKELDSSGIANGWRPEMRYREPNMTDSQAKEWFTEARDLYMATFGRMSLDAGIQ